MLPHGLEESAHASSGLEEPFFRLGCCVGFGFWREIGFGCTYYYVLGVPYSCGVLLVFLVLAGYIFGVTYVLSVQYSFAVVSVFCCGGKLNFVRIPYSHDRFSKISRIFFVKELIPYKTYIQEDQLFLALYGSTIIQTRLFLKNIENFV